MIILKCYAAIKVYGVVAVSLRWCDFADDRIFRSAYHVSRYAAGASVHNAPKSGRRHDTYTEEQKGQKISQICEILRINIVPAISVAEKRSEQFL